MKNLKKIKISTDKQDRESGYVHYRLEGKTLPYLCTIEEWKVYELKERLLKKHPFNEREKLLDEFEDAVRAAVRRDRDEDDSQEGWDRDLT